MTFEVHFFYSPTVTFPAAFLCFAPAARQLAKTEEEREGELEKRAAKSQTKCSFPPPAPAPPPLPSFTLSVFLVTFTKVYVFTQRVSYLGTWEYKIMSH